MSTAVHIVYFSSATENTHRFVRKLGFPADRIPVSPRDPELRVHVPYVLIVPTYGGGASLLGRPAQSVPRQVVRFLRDERNRSLARGVIAGGNSNFGPDFGVAGDKISAKLGIPYLYRFELMGTAEDVERVQEGLVDFFHQAVAG